MQLYAIKFGESSFYSKYVFRDDTSDETMQISWSYYLARFNNKTILFDVGFRDPLIAHEWGITLMNVEHEINSLIKDNPVDTIFITHSHFDHIDNIDLYPDSRIIIAHDDYLHALNNGNPAVKERLLRENVITVKDEFLFDDKFKFKVIGGHTVGSSVIYFEQDGHNFVITGDECYDRDNMNDNRPIGVYASTEKNTAFLEEANRNQYIPLPYHDNSVFQSYKQVSTHIVQIL
ncbi:MBL fold metallo-hydrolase [Cohnella cholangitidis]|uniref:MBL fold metallo-hydrolase n=1 Tax=Cohnella cholangitidis TaxID=2598458 RepID=A0A7G5BST9_9BACL|nr:MBL fold metallo-hydrolase [Cohnella cholangitidis]QMV40023.1 MBL fold metallo-hydrolase [Cohnella cholangitidis]